MSVVETTGQRVGGEAAADHPSLPPDFLNRVSLNHCPVLDVNRLIQSGRFTPNQQFLWGWGDPCWASTRIHVAAQGVTLAFQIGGRSGQRQYQGISIEWVHAQFGGLRPTFVCPVCDLAFYRLYLRGERFACQKCNRLKHTYGGDESDDERERRKQEMEGRWLAHLPASVPSGALIWAEENSLSALGSTTFAIASAPPRIRPPHPSVTEKGNPARRGQGGRPRHNLQEIPCTCGRGDGLEGHTSTCHRGRLIRQRLSRGAPLD